MKEDLDKEFNLEAICFEIISYSGDSKSYSIQALYKARENNFETCKVLLLNAEDTLLKAHNIHSKLLQHSLKGNKINMNLLVTHAQDHYMNAQLVHDMAKEIIMRELDEKISLKYNLVGQETCGVGGFSFAMREIPQMISIAKDVKRYAPNA